MEGELEASESSSFSDIDSLVMFRRDTNSQLCMGQSPAKSTRADIVHINPCMMRYLRVHTYIVIQHIMVDQIRHGA